MSAKIILSTFYLGIALITFGIGPFYKGCNLTFTKYCPLYESTMFDGTVYYTGFRISYSEKGNSIKKTTSEKEKNCIKSTIRATNYEKTENCTCSSDNMYSIASPQCFDISKGDDVHWYKIKGKNTCNRKIDVENSWWAGLILLSSGGSLICVIPCIIIYFNWKNNQPYMYAVRAYLAVDIDVNSDASIEYIPVADIFRSNELDICGQLLSRINSNIPVATNVENNVDAICVECVDSPESDDNVLNL